MKFLYINTGNKYPPDKHLVDGLRENGQEVFELIENEQGLSKYINFTHRFWKNKYSFDVIIVGYGLPFLVPIVRFMSLQKIIFNAVSSQYEANIISRSTDGPWSLIALKWWLVDFISFHFSSKILLESNAQINFVRKYFLVSKNKLILSWMGVDEEVFFRDSNIEKNQKFTALFRGRFLPESGILTVIEAAKKLEDKDVQFLIIGHGFMYREVNALMEKLAPKNIEMINEKLPIEKLREKMLQCHISLGQLADHPRLSRTLPCKLFESLALGLPYLTGRNAGVLELLKENETCFAVLPGNADDLAQKILFLKNNPDTLEKIALQGRELYKEKLTSRQLAKEFVMDCFNK
ncbi:MAG: glycosyltransferase family 4 protein [Patescibacteria group bacterium]